MKGQCSGIYRAFSDELTSSPAASRAKMRRASVRLTLRIDSAYRRQLCAAVSSERGANTRNCALWPIGTPELIRQRRTSRNVTTRRCRKQEASARACEREGTAAQRRGRLCTTNRCVTLCEMRLRELGKTLSELRVEAKVRTRLCGAPQSLFSRAHAHAPSQESPAVRRSRTPLNFSLSEKKASECDSRTYDERSLIGRRSSQCVAPGTRAIAQAVEGPSERSLKSKCTARRALIRFREGHEFCGWIRRRVSEHGQSGGRPTIISWRRTFGAALDQCAPAAAAAPPATLPVVRVRTCEPEQVARRLLHRPVSDGLPESSAQCGRRFPPLPARRTLARILFEDWRFHSVAQVRSLLNNLLKTLLDIRAAAGCCSWNLPGLCGSRLGEKRKRKVAHTVRASMVPTSQYLRKQKCSAVGIPLSAIWPQRTRGFSRYFRNVGRRTRLLKVSDRKANGREALSGAWPHFGVSTSDDATRR